MFVIFVAQRQIIEIDEGKCTGCGLCIPNCPEGALQIIDGKARLVSDLFCDGLGACVGHCPENAMKVTSREAEEYDESRVMENIVKAGPNTIKAHLLHLKEHGAMKYLEEAKEYLQQNNIKVPDIDVKTDNSPCCPGAQIREMKPTPADSHGNTASFASALSHWPVQLNLLPINAPFFDGAHLLIAADCTAFAMGNFHTKLLHGKVVAVGCPKFDDIEHYTEKLTEIFKQNNIKSVTIAIMEVPCCSAMVPVVKDAITNSGKDIPMIKEVVNIDGSLK